MKRRPWAKVWASFFTDEESFQLSADGLLLRIAFVVYSLPDPAHTLGGKETADIGWLVTEAGRPYDEQTLSRLTRLSVKALAAAFAELDRAGLLVLSDQGAHGILGWVRSQESPSTERVRRHRESVSETTKGVTGTVTVTQPVTPDVTPPKLQEEQKREERGTEGFALVHDPVPEKPKRAKRPRQIEAVGVIDDTTAAAIVEALRAERTRCGLTPGNQDSASARRWMADGLARVVKAEGRSRVNVRTADGERVLDLVAAEGAVEAWRVVCRRKANSLLSWARKEGVTCEMVDGGRAAGFFAFENLGRNFGDWLTAREQWDRDQSLTQRSKSGPPVNGLDLDMVDELIKGGAR